MKKEYAISNILIAINIFIFGIFFILNPNFTSYGAIQFGAKVKFALADLQLFRLITANFLHLSIPHIAFNSLALYIFGNQIENLLGKQKFLILFFVSGIFSVMGSAIFLENVSAGASGAIFGLMGVHLYLYVFNKNRYKNVFGADFLILIGFNLIYGFLNKGIDNFGHIFGLISGFSIMVIFGMYAENMKKQFKFSAIALLIIIVILFTNSIIDYKYTPNYYFSKALYLAQTEKVQDSYQLIIEGLNKYPNDAKLLEFKSLFTN